MANRFMRTIKKWLPIAFLATMVCGLAYAAIQQNYRQSANDPQIQMAEDMATALAAATSTPPFAPTGTIDIAKSLAPYVVLYDNSGNPVSGSGMLDGKLPALPSGVFAYTLTTGEDRFTWQPEVGVRSAVIVVRVNGPQPGFVMAGRSLREVEVREGSLELDTDFAWIITLVGTFILQMIFL